MAVQGGVRPTLSVVTFSVDSDFQQNLIFDDPSDKFVIYLEKYYNKKTDICFTSLKDPGIATIDQFESFWTNILSKDKFVIIVYSQCSKNNCETSLSVLFIELMKQNKWKAQFIFVIIGEVDMSGYLLVANDQVLKFSQDEWENSDSNAWMKFCELIQKAVISFDDIEVIDVESISKLDEEYSSRNAVSAVNENDHAYYCEVKGSQNNGYDRVNIQEQHLSMRMNISNSEPHFNSSSKLMQMDDMNRADRRQTKMSISDNEKKRFTSDIGFGKCDGDERNDLLVKGLKLLKIVFILTDLCLRQKSISAKLKKYLKLIIAILGIILLKLKHFFVSSLLAINNYSPIRWLCSLPKFIWIHIYVRLKAYLKHIIAIPVKKALELKHFFQSYFKLLIRWLCYLKEISFHPGQKGKISEEKPCGLKNTRETCYMNAMMQAMAASTNLISELEAVLKDNPSNEKLVLLIDFLKIINDGHVRSNDSATEALISFMTSIQWMRASQQDVYQLLSFCINAVQGDLAIKHKTVPPKLKILHSFSANTDYNKVQDHLGLSIPLCGKFRENPGVDIKVLMDAFFEPSLIDDGPNSTSLNLFENAPEVLILHIQANEWDEKLGMYIKPEYHIKYGKTLTYTFDIKMEKNMSRSEKIEVEYELMAVVRHMGDVSGGHYVTYRKHGHQWFLTNDEQVEAINFECQVVPYVMVYDKVIKKDLQCITLV